MSDPLDIEKIRKGFASFNNLPSSIILDLCDEVERLREQVSVWEGMSMARAAVWRRPDV